MHLDEFESQFKSAVKTPYAYEEIALDSIVLVCDEDEANSEAMLKRVQGLVPALAGSAPPQWRVFGRNQFATVSDLLSQLTAIGPDLVIAERNLKLDHEDNLVYGLTNYIDALTQVLTAPVLLLPNAGHTDTTYDAPKTIMVETNHLTGDSRLINWGVRFAEPNHALYLTHVEDGTAFANYIDAISKIPEIDTALAEQTLHDTLLKLPHDFVGSARARLQSQYPNLKIEEIVRFGTALSDYESIINENSIDLLILNTKEAGQLAMNGIAYAMAVEFKDRPLLLL
jgi:hypothetical protein